MGWIGKLIGGTIGLGLGGPLGGILGAALGHHFDKSDQRYLNGFGGRSEGESEFSHQTKEMTFFVAAFSMLAKLAKADGEISDAEISEIEKFMNEDLRLDESSKIAAINIFRAAKNSRESFESFARQFFNAFSNQRQMLELMIDVLLRVAASDGNVVDNEDMLIRSASSIFGFSDNEYQQIKSKYSSKASNYYYAILNCSADDDDITIKKQYRKLVQEYHPDKIISKGLPEEFVELANEKFKQIQEAYDIICKDRNL